MNKAEEIYIILVNYNGVKDTLDCIESINNQNIQNCHLIVVDNCSEDESVEVLKAQCSCLRFVLLQAETNNGFAAGNNIGIKYALKNDADYIVLLNNDTLINSNFIKPLIRTCREYDNNIIVSPKIMYESNRDILWYAGGTFNKVTSRTTHIGINKFDEGQFSKKREVSFISGCCMVIPNKILLSVGLLNEKYFMYCEDLEYCCRVANSGYKLIYEPDSIIYHKVGASSDKISNFSAFYTIRNKYYIIKDCINPCFHLAARLYNCMEICKRYLKKEYTKKIIRMAKRSYKSNVVGREKFQ